MNKSFKNILLHVGGWIVFLSVPVYLFLTLMSIKDEPTYALDMARLVYTCIILIVLFYVTYYVLIPKYLFHKNFLIYSLLFFLIYLALSGIPVILIEFVWEINNEHQALEFFDLMLLILMYMILFLVSMVLRMSARWQHTEKERISAQLLYLKTQINPHFLFNTLNGIYSTAIDKAPETADMIEKLSSMMRYTLHDTKGDFVPLEKEIKYINNYIDLQKNRFDESVVLDFKLEGNFEENFIAPLLLIPFIENAFKHGVNSEEDSNIYIKISCENNELMLFVKNNKVIIEKGKEEASGLGIDNTKNRLELIYPGKHLLSISDKEDHFIVSLHIILA